MKKESSLNTENEIYFGDKKSFAIRYVPGFTIKDSGQYFAYCHLVLAEQLIGDKNEPCYLNSTWLHYLRLLKDQIKDDFESFKNLEFKNRTDREIFELIDKANQIEEDYKPEYNYLPVLDNEVWRNCSISIDETTDAFLIVMIEDNNAVKFLWEGWRKPCPEDRIGKLFSVSVDRNFVIETIESCLEKIENEYLKYPGFLEYPI